MTTLQLFEIIMIMPLIFISCLNKQDNFVTSTGDVPIYYDVKGKGYPILVFVHGWSRNRNDWDGQIDYFSEKHEVIRLDLAGYGESIGNRNDWSIIAFSHDVMAVIEKLDLKQIVLIGHSLGAPVALETARRLPDRIVGIVAVDAFHDVEEKFTQDQIDDILTPFRNDFMGTYAQGARMMLKDSTQIQKSIEKIASFSPEIGIASLERCYHYNSNDLIPALKEVKVPIRCINSDAIRTNVEAARRYASSFDVIIMEGVGHEMQTADPERFNQLLERILSEFK
jgi:pimeloyl-ACP methyl ester carboxylesterase